MPEFKKVVAGPETVITGVKLEHFRLSEELISPAPSAIAGLQEGDLAPKPAIGMVLRVAYVTLKDDPEQAGMRVVHEHQEAYVSGEEIDAILPAPVAGQAATEYAKSCYDAVGAAVVRMVFDS